MRGKRYRHLQPHGVIASLCKKKQVTRGHNIVADGWAGASNPHPHPNPSTTLKPTQKVSKTLVFPLFDSFTTDGPTDGPTDGQTDRPS